MSQTLGRAPTAVKSTAPGCAVAACDGPGPDTADGDVPSTPGTLVSTFDGERIHVVQAGNRSASTDPALLFVPGWTLAGEIWQPQIDHFGATHLVAAMDPRSQGRSSKAREGHYAAARARDIRAVVEALDLEPVVLVGWSMAVTEVIAYVDLFGTDGLAGLVLVDGLAGMEWEPDMALSYFRWAAQLVHDRRATTEGFVRSMYRGEHDQAYLSGVVDQSLRTPTDAAAALIAGTPANDFRHVLPGLDLPVLITVAPGGPWDALYEEMGRSIPGARLEWFEGAGHALFVDDAPRFNRLLGEFLETLDR